MLKKIIGLGFAVILAGCANGYQQFYQAVPPPSGGFAPFTGEPQMVAGTMDGRATVAQMFQNGYGLVGVADFTGPAENRAGAIAQGKKVGAAIIVVAQKYQSTVSGSVPLTLPSATTSYTSGTASAYGTGGYASGTYSGTTTTYGTQTTFIPYSIDRYEQAALFFAPLPRRGLGVQITPLSTEQRQQIGTNQAVAVLTVRNGSPAFLADVLPGDFLLSVDGMPTYDLPSAGEAFAKASSGSTIVVLHSGQKITKTLTTSPQGW